MADLSYYLASIGEKRESLIYSNRIDTSSSGSQNFIVATAYDELSDSEKTIDHLEIALKNNFPKKEIQNSPLLKNIKKDKRYKTFFKNEN